METAIGSIVGKGRARSGMFREARDGPPPSWRQPHRSEAVALFGREGHIRSRVSHRPQERCMPQTSNRLLDDIARLMTDVAGAAQGVGREFESVVKGQIERLLRDMDIATR